MNLQQDIFNICENEFDFFLDKANVVGIGYANKITNGLTTKEESLTVLVSKKLPKSLLDLADLIPTEYKNIKTDIIEIGELRASGNTSKIRPMQFGYSIGPVNLSYAGTAGCLVKDKNQVYYILSNNHILANGNTLSINYPILQPGTIDGGVNPTDIVATLSKFIPIQFTTATTSPSNLVDCAIARVKDITQVTNTIVNIGVVNGVNTRPGIGLAVKKSGRTTGFTTGVIQALNATVNVQYTGGKTAMFKGQIVSSSMSSPGDSGSLLLDNNNFAVGLLFAGSTSATIYNPIGTVLQQLGVSLA